MGATHRMAADMKRPTRVPDSAPTQIYFDHKLFELWVDSILLKLLDWPATNQISILTTFQEENWPKRIDDPLHPKAGSDTKARLRYAIHSLNGFQQPWLIRFFADGTGHGIRWERVDSSATSSPKYRSNK